jgi:hypothetical protein
MAYQPSDPISALGAFSHRADYNGQGSKLALVCKPEASGFMAGPVDTWMRWPVFHPWLYRRIYICSSVDLHDENDVHACMYFHDKNGRSRV